MSTSSHIGDCALSNLNDHPVTAFALQINTSWAEATRIDSLLSDRSVTIDLACLENRFTMVNLIADSGVTGESTACARCENACSEHGLGDC